MQNEIKETLRKIQKENPYKNEEYYNLDDLGTSKLFATVNKDRILFNKTADSWFIYNNIKWEKDSSGLKVDAYAKEFALAYQKYVEKLEEELNKKSMPLQQKTDEIKELITYKLKIFALNKRKVRNTVIEDSRSYVQVSYEDFDTQPYLFNCLNGVIDLRNRKFLPHSPDLMLSKVANVEYNPSAHCDRFNEFMNDIMEKNRAKINYLQVLFGYAMGGTNELEEAYILYGKTTRNGKSTLLDTIKYLFGDYGMNIQPESLAYQKKSSRAASGDIARIDGCRLLQMSEPPKQMKLDVALLKTLTGRDKITARHLYESEFEFTPVFKLFINTNYLPVVLDDTLFTSGRIKVITFDRHFEPQEQDNGLKDALKDPESLSGILNWILGGYERYSRNHEAITPPQDVTLATEQYRQSSDKVVMFLKDFASEKPAGLYSCSVLYNEYLEWCKQNNYGQDGKSNFISELRKKSGFRERGTVDSKTIRNVFCVDPLRE